MPFEPRKDRQAVFIFMLVIDQGAPATSQHRKNQCWAPENASYKWMVFKWCKISTTACLSSTTWHKAVEAIVIHFQITQSGSATSSSPSSPPMAPSKAGPKCRMRSKDKGITPLTGTGSLMRLPSTHRNCSQKAIRVWLQNARQKEPGSLRKNKDRSQYGTQKYNVGCEDCIKTYWKLNSKKVKLIELDIAFVQTKFYKYVARFHKIYLDYIGSLDFISFPISWLPSQEAVSSKSLRWLADWEYCVVKTCPSWFNPSPSRSS